MSQTAIDFDLLKTNGIKVNYLYVCERKLWLFDRGIQMENTSEKVLLGRLLEEYVYPRQNKKEVLIDNLICIDILDDERIREVKYSNKLAHADRIQILYYLYYLKQLGIEKKGIINYPKIKKKEEVVLTPEAEKEVEEALTKVHEITQMKFPPAVQKKPYCRKCAYFELCFG